MTAISIDQYLALYLWMRYRVVVRRVAATLAFLWACSIIWAVSRVWNIRINKISAIVVGFFSIVLISLC